MTGHNCVAMPTTLRGDAHGTNGWAIAMEEHAFFFLIGKCTSLYLLARCNISPAVQTSRTQMGWIIQAGRALFLGALNAYLSLTNKVQSIAYFIAVNLAT